MKVTYTDSNYLFRAAGGYEDIKETVGEAIDKLAVVVAETSLAYERGTISEEVFRKSLGYGEVLRAYRTLGNASDALRLVHESCYRLYSDYCNADKDPETHSATITTEE